MNSNGINSDDGTEDARDDRERSDHGSPSEPARQQSLQDAAERAEREGLPSGDREIDAYRLVLRGVRQAPMAEIPSDFAQATVLRLQVQRRSELLERLMTQVLIGLLAVAGAVLALPPTLAAVIGAIHKNANPSLQWPLILSAGLALVAVWVVDRVCTLRTPNRQRQRIR